MSELITFNSLFEILLRPMVRQPVALTLSILFLRFVEADLAERLKTVKAFNSLFEIQGVFHGSQPPRLMSSLSILFLRF